MWVRNSGNAKPEKPKPTSYEFPLKIEDVLFESPQSLYKIEAFFLSRFCYKSFLRFCFQQA